MHMSSQLAEECETNLKRLEYLTSCATSGTDRTINAQIEEIQQFLIKTDLTRYRLPNNSSFPSLHAYMQSKPALKAKNRQSESKNSQTKLPQLVQPNKTKIDSLTKDIARLEAWIQYYTEAKAQREGELYNIQNGTLHSSDSFQIRRHAEDS